MSETGKSAIITCLVVCVYVYIYTHTHTHTHTYIYIYIHIHIYIRRTNLCTSVLCYSEKHRLIFLLFVAIDLFSVTFKRQ